MPDENLLTVPELLQAIAEDHDWTRAELARALQTSLSSVDRWSSGRGKPSAPVLERMIALQPDEWPPAERALQRDRKRALAPREIRFRLGLTQSEFAATLGVSRTTVLNWETGKSDPSFAAQRKLKALQSKLRPIRRQPK